MTNDISQMSWTRYVDDGAKCDSYSRGNKSVGMHKRSEIPNI